MFKFLKWWWNSASEDSKFFVVLGTYTVLMCSLVTFVSVWFAPVMIGLLIIGVFALHVIGKVHEYKEQISKDADSIVTRLSKKS